MPENLDPHAAARQWRDRIGLTIAELSKRSGFSVSAIHDFETGELRGTGRAVDPRAFQRYRLACAAIDHGLDRTFNWR